MSQKDSQDPKEQKFFAILKEALELGYSLTFDSRKSSNLFSPIEALLDSVIDILLIMRKLSAGVQGQRLNQGIGFSDTVQDSLGNPKQFRIAQPSKFYWDPEAEEFFFRLAEALVRVKNQKKIKESFHDFLDFLGFTPTSNKQVESRNNRAKHFFWWRRQQRRYRR